MDEKPKVKLKTVSFNIKNDYHSKVFDIMTHYSKNIFNHILFIYNIYKYFQDDIFSDLYSWIISNQDIIKYFEERHKLENKNNKKGIDKVYDTYKSKVHDKLYLIYEKYYKLHSSYKKLKDINNKIIYEYINKNLNRNLLSSDTFTEIKNKYISETEPLISFNKENKFYVHDKIVIEILISIYYKIFYTTKMQINNNEPITMTNNEKFIEQIKLNKIINELKNENKFYNKIKKGLYIDIHMEDNIIGRLVYKYIDKDLKDKLPSDIITNIIKKVYESIKSYYALRSQGIKANKPYYKKYKDKFNLFYYTHSFKILEDNKRIRMTVGDNISKEFTNLINSDCTYNNFNIIQITENLFTYKNFLQKEIKKNEKNNYKIIFDYNKNKRYVHKKNIYDNYYLYIDIPKKLRKENIRYIEVIPRYEGYKYQINITYEDKNKYNKTEDINKIKIEDSVSIDLGVANMMTIYNPKGKQYIINGKALKSKNEYYNKKIGEYQSKNNKEKMNELLLNREKEIKGFTKELIKKIYELYKDKKLIIIGYNKNWKQNVNIGKRNNRIFMGIPYKKILIKLEEKLKEKGILIRTIKESYTSKCDAQSLEEICKKEEYNGTRINRGLYLSKKTNKTINADMNGAINIMRRHYGKSYDRILGNIYNPRVINIISESK